MTEGVSTGVTTGGTTGVTTGVTIGVTTGMIEGRELSAGGIVGVVEFKKPESGSGTEVVF